MLASSLIIHGSDRSQLKDKHDLQRWCGAGGHSQWYGRLLCCQLIPSWGHWGSRAGENWAITPSPSPRFLPLCLKNSWQFWGPLPLPPANRLSGSDPGWGRWQSAEITRKIANRRHSFGLCNWRCQYKDSGRKWTVLLPGTFHYSGSFWLLIPLCFNWPVLWCICAGRVLLGIYIMVFVFVVLRVSGRFLSWLELLLEPSPVAHQLLINKQNTLNHATLPGTFRSAWSRSIDDAAGVDWGLVMQIDYFLSSHEKVSIFSANS